MDGIDWSAVGWTVLLLLVAFVVAHAMTTPERDDDEHR